MVSQHKATIGEVARFVPDTKAYFKAQLSMEGIKREGLTNFALKHQIAVAGSFMKS
jgi:hypothetical protein